MVLTGFVQAGSHDFSRTPHHLQGNAQALLDGLQAQVIEKHRLALAQQNSRQQHSLTQVLALQAINQVLPGEQPVTTCSQPQ